MINYKISFIHVRRSIFIHEGRDKKFWLSACMKGIHHTSYCDFDPLVLKQCIRTSGSKKRTSGDKDRIIYILVYLWCLNQIDRTDLVLMVHGWMDVLFRRTSIFPIYYMWEWAIGLVRCGWYDCTRWCAGWHVFFYNKCWGDFDITYACF